MINEITVRFSGEQGTGVQYTGQLAARFFAESGYNVFALNDFESIIKGGYSFVQLRVANFKCFTLKKTPDICIPFTNSSLNTDLNSISLKTTIFLSKDFLSTSSPLTNHDFFSIDVKNIINKELSFVNTFYLSILVGIFNLDIELLKNILKSTLYKKGEDIINANVTAAENGYNYAKNLDIKKFHLKKTNNLNCLERACTGAFALTFGAVMSNCKFYSAYPMSPSTSIINMLSEWSKDLGIVVEQAEDEIAALNLALGASYSGVRALVGTSGGGLALMSETISLAAIAEVPIVIINAQRPSPATGLPTRTEQGDLLFTLFIGHGEFTRVILAPGTHENAFELIQKGFYLADKYQIPVFILMDQLLMDSIKTCKKSVVIDKYQERYIDNSKDLKETYLRYAFNESGVSPRRIPGEDNMPVVADSHTHEESGYITEDMDIRKKGVEKLLTKKNSIIKEIDPPYISTKDSKEIILIGWGSTYGVINEVAAILNKKGFSLCHIHYHEIYPLNVDFFTNQPKYYKRLICIENNATAQFARLLKMEGNIIVDESILKYDGRTFYLDELLNKVEKRIEVINYGT